MQVTKVKLDYNQGDSELIIPKGTGFIITEDKLVPLADWSVEDLMNAVSRMLIVGLGNRIDDYGTFKPLFELLNESIQQVKKILSPATTALEFSREFDRRFLYDEIMEDKKLKKSEQKYADVLAKLEVFREKATANLNDK